MAEEVSPESKLYVKEEIEKIRKEFKGDLKEVRSKATKIFSVVAMIIGLVTGVSVFLSISNAIHEEIKTEGYEQLKSEAEGYVTDACDLHAKIVMYEKAANDSYKNIVEIETKLEQIIPVGSIVPYGGEIPDKTGALTEVKEGWLFCNGASLDREKYEDLFKVIGEAFGAPDSDTFNLPDLRGRFVRGVDYGQRRDPDAQSRKDSNEGGNTGDKIGSIQLDNIQTHSHQWGENDSGNLYSWNNKSTRVLALHRYGHPQIPRGGGALDDDQMDVKNHRFWTKPEPSVGISVTETRPKNIYVNWIIKAR